MSEVVTPGRKSAKGTGLRYTPYSVITHNQSRTPRFARTPLTRRLVASTKAHQNESEEKRYGYEGLLKTSWKVYSLSPLYKFNVTRTSLTKYARSLDVALSQEKVQSIQTENESNGNVKSSFSVYEGLNFRTSDAQAVQIQVTEKTDTARGTKVVLNALLICVDLDSSPVPENQANNFTYYPVILVSGSKARSDILLSWLERHFDCSSSPIQFSDNDLRWMVVTFISEDVVKETDLVVLQYSLENICEGISTIDCKFEAKFCKKLLESLKDSSSSGETLNETDVTQFVDALERHLEYTMHIYFSKLNMSAISTSVAALSSQGKLKLFSSSGVFPALHLICEIVKDRFMDIRNFLT